MKNLRQLVFMFASLLLVIGCTKDLSDEIDDLKDRVTSLEENTTQINKDIKNISDIINAISGQEQITAVDELDGKSGYKITFSKNGEVSRVIEIKNGTNGTNAPIISVAKNTDDGKYYWTQTIDGVTSWLTDSNGKMPAAITPTIGIDAGGYWTIDMNDGGGVNRMTDVNGNQIKAKGEDGEAGILGFQLSADGRYAVFTIGGIEYKFEVSAFTIGLQTDAYDIIYMEQSAVRTLKILLPANLKKDDFTALSATMEGKNGGASDVVTRAAATALWQVSLTKPTYAVDGTIENAPTVEITAPNSAVVGDGAIVTVSILDKNGNKVSVSRAIEIVENATLIYTPTSGVFNLPDPTSGKQQNVVVNMTANQTGAQKIVIPDTYTKENTPAITVNFSTGVAFTAGTFTIEAPSYDGTIIIQGTDNSHDALSNSGGVALVVDSENATVIVQNIKIIGTSEIAVSPNTFVVRTAELGAISVSTGSVNIESGAKVSGTITSNSPHPITIGGEVTDKIVSVSPVAVQPTAKTSHIQAAGITVAEGAKVDGAVTSTGTGSVEIKGEVTGTVKAPEAENVEVGEKAKIGGDLETGENANVNLNPDADITGGIKIPVSQANISIGETAYKNIDAAVINSNDGDIINIKAGTYSVVETIAKNITLKGVSPKETIIKTDIVASSSLTIEGIGINVTSVLGHGAVNMLSGDVKLTLKDVDITQNALGNKDGLSTVGLGVYFGTVDNVSTLGNVELEMINSNINLCGNYQRGVAFGGGSNTYYANVTLDNSTIITKDYLSKNDEYSRGIALYQTKGGIVTMKNNSKIEGVYYPLNMVGDDITINIENSSLAGYCAINSHAPNSTYNITNSVLTGRNYYPAGTNDFATIKINSGIKENVFNIDGSTITNVVTNTSVQYMSYVGGKNNTFNFIGAKSSLIDSQKGNHSKHLPFMIGSDYGCAPKITGIDNINIDAYKYTILSQYWGDTMYGDGSEENPYRLIYYNDFELIGTTLPADAHYVQLRDIFFPGSSYPHKPICKRTAPFMGVYDGDGFNIGGVYINGTTTPGEDPAELGDAFGLFAVTGPGSMIKNVNLTKNNSAKIQAIGSSAGFADSYNSIAIGAIVGICKGNIENCTNEVEVIGNGSENNSVGGIAGWVTSPGPNNGGLPITINNCVNKANISTIGEVAGIVGAISANPIVVTITNCSNSGNISSSAGQANGIFGKPYFGEVIESGNQNTGTVTGPAVD